jgi:hypothetical protein
LTCGIPRFPGLSGVCPSVCPGLNLASRGANREPPGLSVAIAPLSPIDVAAQVIADPQNGNLTYAQLLAVGFTKEAIRLTLEAGHVTVRLTKRRPRGQPDREAARLHNILGARRAA